MAEHLTKEYFDEQIETVLRMVNDKLDFVIALLRRHNLVSDDELRRIRTEFQIFPALS